MARKTTRKASGKAGDKTTPRTEPRRAATSPARSENDRERIVAGFLALLAEKPFETIGLGDVAREADVSLAQLRGEFASTIAILGAHFKAVDRAVLAADVSDMAEEPDRERLFDVLMRRLDMLSPHREAVRSLMRSARRDPPLALALNSFAVRSQQWMLSAAG